MIYDTQDNKYFYDKKNIKIEVSFTDGAFDYINIGPEKYDREDIKLLKEVFDKIDVLQELQNKKGEV